MSIGGMTTQQQQQPQPAAQSNGNGASSDDSKLPALTDKNMTSAQWAKVAATIPTGGTGGNPPGVPSDQWGPFGLTPPPGSPAAKDFWMNIQYGDSPPPGAVPMDPSQYTDMYERMSRNSSTYGGGMQIPVGVVGSQFNPTKDNPNFIITDDGYGRLSDQGQQNLNAYAMDQLQSIYRNAAKNRAGLSGFLGTPAGAMTMLAFPALVGGGVGLLGGAAGAAGTGAAGAAEAATAAAPAATAAAPAAAAAAPATSTLGSALSSIGHFLINPLASLGLPSWVGPAFQGVDLLGQMMTPPPDQQGRG